MASPSPVPTPAPLPRLDPGALRGRLDSVRQALGADVLFLLRRGLAAGAPLEALGRSDERASDPIVPPLVLAGEVLAQGRPLRRCTTERSLVRPWLVRHEFHAVEAWPLPNDRRPTLVAVAAWVLPADPGEGRRRIAMAGLEALGRALSPPPWMLASLERQVDRPAPAGPRLPLCAHGKSAAARELQSLWRRLVDRGGPGVLSGPPGAGIEELLRELHLRGPAALRERSLLVLPLAERVQEELAAELEAGSRGAGTLVLEHPDRLPAAAQRQLAGWLAARVDRAAPRILLRLSTSPEQAMRDGRLRGELYGELRGPQLTVPSLRARSGDMGELCTEILRREAGASAPGLDAAALEAVRAQDWPGELRQLRRCLSTALLRHPRADTLTVARLGLRPAPGKAEPGPPVAGDPLGGLLPLREAVAVVEERMLRRALQVAEGNKSDAARRLRLSRQGFYKKLHRYGLLDGAAGDGS